MPAWMKKITLKEKTFIINFFARKGDIKDEKLDKAEMLLAKAEEMEEQARFIKSMCYEVLRRR